MFLVDDIVLSPVKGLLYVFREIHRAVEQDAGNEAEAVRSDLGELYMLLETQQITEEEADIREKLLLDRLDMIESRGPAVEDDEDDDDDDEAEERTDDLDELEAMASTARTQVCHDDF